jgi:hypothetical protein
MYDFVVFLLLFASCTGCVALKVEDAKRCDPVCAPYAFEYVSAKGECVCNLQKV